MAELARWCRAQSLSETMTNAVIKAFVDLDSLRSCANDPGMVDEGLKEQNLPVALRIVRSTGRRSASANAPGARLASSGHAPARTQETSAAAGRRTPTPKETLLWRSERDARGRRVAVPGGDTSTTVV